MELIDGESFTGFRMNQQQRAEKANRVTWTGLWVNVVLTLFKLFAGILGRSGAMIADAIHSFSDFATDIVVLLGFRIVRKPADESHDYGHGKVETLMTVIIGGALIYVGGRIFATSAKQIFDALAGKELAQPGWIALVGAALSIVVKEWLYQLTVHAGNEINSQAVIANAWHHRSDAYSSIGTLLGIGGAILLGERWRLLDPLAAVVVSIFIVRVGVVIARAGINDLLEASVSDTTKKDIRQTVESVKGIVDAHDLKTRRIGNAIAIDIHITVERDLSIVEAHDIATTAEDLVRERFGEDTVVNVHMEPR